MPRRVESTGISIISHDSASSIEPALRTFIEKSVLPRIPTDLREALLLRGVAIELSSDVTLDGQFIATDSGPLRIEIRSSLVKSAALEPLIAHELFHAVHYLAHPDEEPWIREGLAQVFEHQVTRRYPGVQLQLGLQKLGTPLMAHFDPRQGIDPAAYGHVLLYFRYLLDRCGGEALFWKLTRGVPGEFGPAGIDHALKTGESIAEPSDRTPFVCASFAASARAFEIARAHNRPSRAEGSPYFLLSSTLRAIPEKSRPTRSRLQEMKPYEPLLLEANAAPDFELPLGWFQAWLETRFPYRVAFGKIPVNADPSVWNLLIFRE